MKSDLGLTSDLGLSPDLDASSADAADAALLDADAPDAALCAPEGVLRWPTDSVQGMLPIVADRPGCRGDSSNHAVVWRLEIPTESTVVLHAEVLVPGAHAFLRVRPACGDARASRGPLAIFQSIWAMLALAALWLLARYVLP